MPVAARVRVCVRSKDRVLHLVGGVVWVIGIAIMSIIRYSEKPTTTATITSKCAIISSKKQNKKIAHKIEGLHLTHPSRVIRAYTAATNEDVFSKE